MYQPPHFKVRDQEQALYFIDSIGLGTLVSQLDGRLFASHLPMMLDAGKKTLLGHIARMNPQHLELDGQEALFVVQGPHGYISPAWYREPGVPTWNYQAVHVYGRCRIVTDLNSLRNIVDTLTHRYEAGMDKPWKPEYGDNKLGAIVGIELEIGEIQCKFKLSQNRSEEERDNVIRQLNARGNSELAAAMQYQGK